MILKQICSALQYLHSLNFIHGNLKPSNVLISFASGIVRSSIKLADFEFRYLPIHNRSTPYTLAEYIPTEGWIALDLVLTKATDIFPLGCLFCYVLVKGFHPFGVDVAERCFLILKKNAMVLKAEQLNDAKKGDNAFSLIQSMLSVAPDERPSIEKVLNSEFFIDKVMDDAPGKFPSN